jgi:hypothetical protein
LAQKPANVDEIQESYQNLSQRLFVARRDLTPSQQRAVLAPVCDMVSELTLPSGRKPPSLKLWVEFFAWLDPPLPEWIEGFETDMQQLGPQDELAVVYDSYRPQIDEFLEYLPPPFQKIILDPVRGSLLQLRKEFPMDVFVARRHLTTFFEWFHDVDEGSRKGRADENDDGEDAEGNGNGVIDDRALREQFIREARGRDAASSVAGGAAGTGGAVGGGLFGAGRNGKIGRLTGNVSSQDYRSGSGADGAPLSANRYNTAHDVYRSASSVSSALMRRQAPIFFQRVLSLHRSVFSWATSKRWAQERNGIEARTCAAVVDQILREHSFDYEKVEQLRSVEIMVRRLQGLTLAEQNLDGQGWYMANLLADPMLQDGLPIDQGLLGELQKTAKYRKGGDKPKGGLGGGGGGGHGQGARGGDRQ